MTRIIRWIGTLFGRTTNTRPTATEERNCMTDIAARHAGVSPCWSLVSHW